MVVGGTVVVVVVVVVVVLVVLVVGVVVDGGLVVVVVGLTPVPGLAAGVGNVHSAAAQSCGWAATTTSTPGIEL